MSNISYKHFIYDHELMLYPYAPIGLLHNKGEWPQPEYNLSIVISASFEDMNIIEWISYHLALGVDHIYLYCTDEDPTDLYHKIIAFTLGKKPSITFNHYRFSKSIAPIYFHFIRNYLHKTEWYIHLEITDYLYIHEKQTLQLFLESFNDTNVICFNLILYNNLKQEEVKSIKTIFSKTKPINFPFIFTKLMVRSKACPYQYIFENLNKRIDYHIPNQSLIDHSRNVLHHSMQTYYDDFPHNALKSLNSNTQAQISNTAYIAHFCQSDDTQETIDNLSLLYTNEKTTLKLQSNASSATPHSTPDKYWIKILKNLWKNSFLPAPTPLITVLSNNKPCNQSSAPKQTIPETFAISLIKGQLKGVTQTITHKETDPWWEIDLEKSYIVKNIRLYNGIDLNIKNANHFIIESSENHQIWIKRHQKTTSNLFGGSDGTYYNWIHPLGIKARWIRITIPGNNQIFSLDQIEILGMEHKNFYIP